MTKYKLIERAIELLAEEHPECDDNTCLINSAAIELYPLSVIEEFRGSGAASNKFERVAIELRSKFKKYLIALNRESNRLCKEVEHQTCAECNAVIWDVEGYYSEGEAIRCASCGKQVVWKAQKD